MVPSVEVAKKLVDVFGITMDYLVDETGNVTVIRDRAILERMLEIEHLENDEEQTIIHVIDSLLRDAKARKTYAIHGPH